MTVDSAVAVVYSREPLTGALELEVKPLLEAHWEEIAHFKDIPLAVSWEAYRSLESRQQLHIYTVRALEPGAVGPLVGYAVYFVRPHPHYFTTLMAVQDVLYLDPDLRGEGVGAALIAFADQGLAAAGVKVVYHHVKLAHDFGSLLARQGYAPIETVWGRHL